MYFLCIFLLNFFVTNLFINFYNYYQYCYNSYSECISEDHGIWGSDIHQVLVKIWPRFDENRGCFLHMILCKFPKIALFWHFRSSALFFSPSLGTIELPLFFIPNLAVFPFSEIRKNPITGKITILKKSVGRFSRGMTKMAYPLFLHFF